MNLIFEADNKTGGLITSGTFAMRTVKEFGLSVPDDVRIAGFSDDPFSSFWNHR